MKTSTETVPVLLLKNKTTHFWGRNNAPINVKPLGEGGRVGGKGGGFDSNHRPVVGFCDRFNGLSSNILLTFSCYFVDSPQCPGVGHLNGNSQLSSNAPPMPGLPPPVA